MTRAVRDSGSQGNLGRLARVEGQIRGVNRMIAEGEPAMEVLMQIRASKSALAAVARGMLRDHIAAFVGGKNRNQAEMDEITRVVRLLTD